MLWPQHRRSRERLVEFHPSSTSAFEVGAFRLGTQSAHKLRGQLIPFPEGVPLTSTGRVWIVLPSEQRPVPLLRYNDPSFFAHRLMPYFSWSFTCADPPLAIWFLFILGLIAPVFVGSVSRSLLYLCLHSLPQTFCWDINRLPWYMVSLEIVPYQRDWLTHLVDLDHFFL